MLSLSTAIPYVSYVKRALQTSLTCAGKCSLSGRGEAQCSAVSLYACGKHCEPPVQLSRLGNKRTQADRGVMSQAWRG